MTAQELARIETICVELSDSAAFTPAAMLRMVAEVRRLRSVIAEMLIMSRLRGPESLADDMAEQVKRVAGH